MRMSETGPITTTSDTSGGKDSLSLSQFLLRQRGENEQGKMKKEVAAVQKKETYQEMLKQKEITATSRGVYADVLTREFFAIQSLTETAGFTPTLWQQRILDVVDPNGEVFKKTQGGVDLPKKQSEQYAAYRKVFAELIQKGESDDPDEAREWLKKAMEETKRQIIAVQAITQANVKVHGEESEQEFVDDIEVTSAAMAHETGKPLDKIREELVELRKSQVKNPKWWQFIQRIKVANHRNLAGLSMIDAKKYIQDKWNQFNAETSKDVFSAIEVDFPNGHTVDYTRTVDGESLDEVQKRMVESFASIGTRNTARELGIKGQAEAAQLLKDMVGAQQNAYFAEFDTKLRTSEHFNLIEADIADPQNFTHTYSGLDPIRPQIEGVAELPVNIDNLGVLSLDQRLDIITMNIGKRTEKRIKKIERSEVKGAVTDRIAELTKRKTRELDPEETVQKAELEKQKTAGEEIKRLSEVVAQSHQEIELQKANLKEPIDARDLIKKTEDEKKVLLEDKSQHEGDKGSKERELESLDQQVKGLRASLGLKGVNAAEVNTQIGTVLGEITALKGELYTNADSLRVKIKTATDEIAKKDKTLKDNQEIVDSHAQALASFDQLKKVHDQNIANLANLQRRYPRGINLLQVERRLKNMSGINSSEQVELDILTSFNTEILGETKWDSIYSRSYTETTSSPIVRQELELAMDARPHVQPAYLFMIRTIAGEKAIQNTKDGHKKFAEFSKLIPPSLFFEIYMRNPQRIASLQNAFNGAHGVLPVIGSLTIYDEELQHPDVRRELLQGIDKGFIQELTQELVHRARKGELGVELATDQHCIDEIEAVEISKTASQEQEEQLEQLVGEYKRMGKIGSEIHSGMAAERVLAEVTRLGLRPDEAKSAIEAVQNSLKLCGIDRDVAIADFFPPSTFQTRLNDAFIDAGLLGLTARVRRDLINFIRREGIDGTEVEPYARIEQAVTTAGLDRKQAPYVVAAIKRAAMKAGFIGDGITSLMLESPPGTLTPEGIIVFSELRGIDIAISADQQVALLNAIPKEFVLQTFSSTGVALFDGTKRFGARADLGYDVLVVDRTMLSMNIDQTKEFVVADVTPAIRAKIKEEYAQIGLDIDNAADVWTDQDVAGVIEAVRGDVNIVRMDYDPQKNATLHKLFIDAGLPADKTLDIVLEIQKSTQEAIASGRPVSATKFKSDIKNMLIKVTGMSPLPPTVTSKLSSIIGESQRVQIRQVHESTSRKIEVASSIVEQFLDFDGSYHEAAYLGVLLSELDMGSMEVVRQAFEQVLLHNESREIASILARIPVPPQDHIREKVGHIMSDGINGFLDIYNREHPPGGHRLQDIPVEEIRQMAGLVVGHRLGAIVSPPFPGYIEAKSSSFADLNSAQFSKVQFERVAIKLDATFWGLEAEKLTYAIEKKLGGMAYRNDALIYTQKINELRAKRGFIKETV